MTSWICVMSCHSRLGPGVGLGFVGQLLFIPIPTYLLRTGGYGFKGISTSSKMVEDIFTLPPALCLPGLDLRTQAASKAYITGWSGKTSGFLDIWGFLQIG